MMIKIYIRPQLTGYNFPLSNANSKERVDNTSLYPFFLTDFFMFSTVFQLFLGILFLGDDEDDMSLTMEIAIATPEGQQKTEVAELATKMKDCQSGEPCQNGGLCRSVQGIGRAKCLCPIGYFGPQCDESKLVAYSKTLRGSFPYIHTLQDFNQRISLKGLQHVS